MFLGYPIFQAERDTELIPKIFKALGTPTEETWPGITELISIVMPNYPSKQIRLDEMDDLAVDLLNKMLLLNPLERISAKEALQHAYFSVDYN